MNNTKEVKRFFESVITERLEKAIEAIKTEGFTQNTYTELRGLENDLAHMNAAEHFFNAWHDQGRGAQCRKGA